jgi:thymidine kinase
MSLELIIGCMFSGKSTELIRRIRRYQSIGKKVCVINHNADTRTDNKVQTHYGDNIDSLKYAHLMNFVNVEQSKHFDVVCIDEAQFFHDLYASIIVMVEEYNIKVIVAGLSGDYNLDNFGAIHKLIPYADDIHLCKAYCGNCKDGTVATFTKRLSDGKKQVEIGADDKYMAVCRKCYLKRSF